MEYSRLYLIGNGFDMHHNINSSYFEYRMWLKENYEDVYWELVNTFNIDDESTEGIALLSEKRHPWWKFFENSLGEIDLADIVDNCVFNNYPDFGSDEFRDRDYHAAEFDAELILRKLVSDIKGTFEEWICSLAAPDMGKKIYINRSNAFYISFNYTDTLETLYNIPPTQIWYIHGKANRNEDLMVGHNKSWEELDRLADNTPNPPLTADTEELLDEWYSSNGDFITDQTRIVAIREYSNLQKDTLSIISNNKERWDAFSSVHEIHIYGFSFSDVDLPYLSVIKKVVAPDTKWIVSYYSCKEKDSFINILSSIGVNRSNIEMIRLKDITLSNKYQLKLFSEKDFGEI